jgi:hypothetical protein
MTVLFREGFESGNTYFVFAALAGFNLSISAHILALVSGARQKGGINVVNVLFV